MDIRNLINSDAPAQGKEESRQSSRPLSTPTSAARGSWAQASPSAVGNGMPGQSAVFPAAGYPPPGRNEVRHSAPTYGQSPSSMGTQSRPQSQPQIIPAAGYPPPVRHEVRHSAPVHTYRDESVSPKTMLPPQPHPPHTPHTPTSNGGIKRSASHLSETPPPKRLCPVRKHAVRPIWARLNPRNPRASQVQQVQPSLNSPAHLTKTHNNNNATVSIAAPNETNKPSTETLPVDYDMLLMRKILSGGWERSIKGTSPLPSLTRAVTDWLVQHLSACNDICQDPAEGHIEIEAKVGRLFSTSTGQRFGLPVKNMVVLDESFAANNCTFESEVQEHEYKAMNQFLNQEWVKTQSTPGRQKLRYEHLQEIDYFERLSKFGLGAIPEAVARLNKQREPKLRTTKENDPRTNRVGQIKARIIKVKLADLHIYNPQSDYDLRITMNVECNLMRPELDTDALVEAETPDKPNPPARKKDRMSYKHLGLYQVDATRVDQAGMAHKYELELEVDAGPLRAQLIPLLNSRESGFTQIVDGFLDNATWLMRVGP